MEFSNDVFNVDSAHDGFLQGTSGNIVVNYAPVNANGTPP